MTGAICWPTPNMTRNQMAGVGSWTSSGCKEYNMSSQELEGLRFKVCPLHLWHLVVQATRGGGWRQGRPWWGVCTPDGMPQGTAGTAPFLSASRAAPGSRRSWHARTCAADCRAGTCTWSGDASLQEICSYRPWHPCSMLTLSQARAGGDAGGRTRYSRSLAACLLSTRGHTLGGNTSRSWPLQQTRCRA